VREIKIKNLKVKIALPVVLFLGSFLLLFGAIKVWAVSYLSGGSATLSDSRPSATMVDYTFDFDNVTLSAIKCMKIQFNTQAGGGGSVPTGFSNIGTYNVAASDFVPDVQTWVGDTATAGVIKITNGTGEIPASSADRTIVINGLTNGSTVDTAFYAIFTTYSDTDCTTGGVDSGTVTFIYTTGQAVSLTVIPSISFAISAVAIGQSVNGAAVSVLTTTASIPFSTVTTSANAIAAHTLTVNTNAGSGYFVYTKYTAKPTYNVVNDINDHGGNHTTPTTMSTGTEAFGYTTEDTDYSQFQTNKYAAFTTTNAEIAKSTAAVSNDQTKVGYEVGVAGDTPAGTYQTTVVLTCTPMY